MKYLILQPEILVIFWLIVITCTEIKEIYETKKIKKKKSDTESREINKIIAFNIFLNNFLLFYYMNFNHKEIELFKEGIRIGSEEVKIRLLITILFLLGLTFYYKEKKTEKKLEYIQLLLMLYLSTLLIVIVSNLFAVYLLIELQSLIFYFLIGWTIQGNSIKEGILFFFQSIVFSILLMLGLYFIYLSTTSFDLHFLFDLKFYMENNKILYSFENFIFNLGIYLIIISILFKLGIFPFHLWLIKVLKNSNTIVMYYVGVFSKLGILYFLYKWFEIFSVGNKIFVTVGVLSLIIGGLGGIIQTRITNIFFFSSLTHIGLLLLIYTMKTELSGIIYIYYLIMYIFLSFGFVYFILDVEKCKRIENLKYFYDESKITSLNIILLLFSYIGLPPFLGFFFKLGAIISVGLNLEEVGNSWIILFILVSSLASLIMYLKVNKNLVYGSYEEKTQMWFSVDIRENVEIKEKNRIFLCLLLLFINLGMVFWYTEIFTLILEC